ncbi:hypothetical protein ACFVAD_18140 [Sutcliffiella sp. NPDC057660]|uniref:hypothetical protein n=1 Tax=Sutcliffiella sp. NPDC057660 TaxID=3346199 RepID=UPI0036A2FC03
MTKKSILVIFFLVIISLLFACSTKEIIRIATPTYEKGVEGVTFYSEVTDQKKISQLRTVVEKLERIENPKSESDLADVFFTLDNPEENYSEIGAYIWYKDDGTATLKRGEKNYYHVTKEQVDILKEILN